MGPRFFSMSEEVSQMQVFDGQPQFIAANLEVYSEFGSAHGLVPSLVAMATAFFLVALVRVSLNLSLVWVTFKEKWVHLLYHTFPVLFSVYNIIFYSFNLDTLIIFFCVLDYVEILRSFRGTTNILLALTALLEAMHQSVRSYLVY